MKRWLLAFVLALVVLVPAAHAGGPVILVKNASTSVPAAQVAAVVPALQTLVSRDLAPVWGTDATLTTDRSVAHQMTVLILDDAPFLCGCLGYHDVEHGQPVSRIFAATGADYNEAWTLTASHELEEMLVDPSTSRLQSWNSRSWLVEVSDPVESGYFAYFIDGVAISDFITPAWYGGPGPYDFTGWLSRPGQISRHGYASYRLGSGWGQVFG